MHDRPAAPPHAAPAIAASVTTSADAAAASTAAAPAAIGHYENFPVASWLCPPQLRAPIAAIYHFARTADDIADEGDASPTQRLADLALYRCGLQAQSDASPPVAHSHVAALARWPQVFYPLHVQCQAHALPLPLLHALLDAFVQDVEKTRDASGYHSHAELLDYCSRSANPVGRLLLHLYGVHNAAALAMSDAICTALQLINFWQDLSIDLPRGRYYLPLDMCAQHGVSQRALRAQEDSPNATKLIAACADLARLSMQKGMPLVHLLPGRAGWELRLVVQGGLRILDKIAALDHATLRQRPRLHSADYARMLWRAVWM